MSGADDIGSQPAEGAGARGGGAMLSIGALSQATGIPTATLRTWERRYGFPLAERLASGHRRYRPAAVQRLLRVRALMEHGHRPADLLASSDGDLERLERTVLVAGATDQAAAEAGPADDAVVAAPASSVTPALRVAAGAVGEIDWAALRKAAIDAAARLDEVAIAAIFRHTWERAGGHAFLVHFAATWLVEVGNAWATRRIGVAQEHFASERLRDFLVDHWRGLAAGLSPAVIAATLPGERHVLGLHLAVTGLALEGVGCVFLGAETPLDEIGAAVAEVDAAAVAISVALGADAASTSAQLEVLAAALPTGCALLVGGAGALELALPPVTIRMRTLDDVTSWARGFLLRSR